MVVGGGKKANQVFTEEPEEMPQEVEVEKERVVTPNQRREFLKKKPKYDPRKAIEESKKKAEEYHQLILNNVSLTRI